MPDKPKDDAIQEDVLDKGENEKEIESRESAIDQIVSNLDSERKKEMDMEPDVELDPEVSEKKPEKDKEPDPEKDKEPEPDKDKEPDKKDDEPEPDKEEMVTIKVHGKEQQVPISKIRDAGIRTLQKESAADESLSEAKQILSELKTLKDSLAKPAKEPDKDTPDEEDVSDKTDFSKMTTSEIREAIRYGDDDEAEAAIEYLMTSKSESLSADDIKKMVRSQVDELTFDEILERFKKSPDEGGYSDLLDDEFIYSIVNTRVNKLVKEGKSVKDWNTYQEAGNWVRETILGQKPDVKKEPEKKDLTPEEQLKKDLNEKSVLDEKIEKKRKLTVVDQASKTIEAKSEDADKTEKQARSDAIKDMQKQREAGR